MTDYSNADLETRKKLATAEDTADHVLEVLSNDSEPDVRSLVASNPNTSPTTLQKLGQEFPDVITDNPIFGLLLIENPHSYFIRLSLARSSTTSGEILTKLAATKKYSDREICWAVANNINTPISVLEKLATWFPERDEFSAAEDGDLVHIGVAINPNTPPHVLEQLSHHHRTLVRKKVAQHPNTSVSVLERLINDNHKKVVLEVAKNPNISLSKALLLKIQSLLEYLAGEYDQYDQNLIFLTQEDRGLLDDITNHPHVPESAMQIIDAIDNKPGVPIAILEKLAQDSRYYVRKKLAKNTHLPAYLMESLAEDQQPEVRREIAKNIATPVTILAKLANDFHSSIRESVAKNTTTPRNILLKLSQDRSIRVKQSILSRKDLSVEMIAEMFNRILSLTNEIS